MPDILIGSIEWTEANTHTQCTMSTPIITGYNINFPHRLGFATIYSQFHLFTDITIQGCFKHFIILILENTTIFNRKGQDYNHEIEK